MALAGPAANFLLAILAGSAMVIGLHMGYFTPGPGGEMLSVVDPTTPGAGEAVARFLSLLFSLNILLGTFNLIPVPPLDGFNAIPILLSEDAGRNYLAWADSIRSYSFVGLLVAWQLYGRMFWPIFDLATQTLYR